MDQSSFVELCYVKSYVINGEANTQIYVKKNIVLNKHVLPKIPIYIFTFIYVRRLQRQWFYKPRSPITK